MRTVGTVLKEARNKKNMSLSYISETTKIKEKFLEALEESFWANLPNYSIAQGFVKSYANIVGVEKEMALALLRRDFPAFSREAKREESIKISTQFNWTPRLTILATTLITASLVAFYLLRQYLLFVAPPPLKVDVVRSGQEVVVSGRTNSQATLEINGVPTLLERDGSFTKKFEKGELGNSIEIKSTSRSGKSTIKVTPVSQ